MGHQLPYLGALQVDALFAPDAAVAASSDPSTNPVVQLGPAVGDAMVVLQAVKASAGTSPTLDVKLQHCDTAGGTFADVPDGAFATVTDAADACAALVFHAGELKEFVSVAVTVAGASASFPALAVSLLHQPA